MIDGRIKHAGKSGARVGTQALRLLATPINVHVLQGLAVRPKSLIDLRREAGSPPQATMRAYLRALDETGVVTRRRQEGFPGSIDLELTGSGRDLIGVTEVLRVWLAAMPEGPLELGSTAAESAVKALVEGWSTTMVRALAAGPLSLTELDSLIAAVSYPSLERRLAAMRLAGQVKKMPGRGKRTPYAVTQWLRQAMAPICAAARWEQRHLGEQAVPIGYRDVEAGLLLTVPMLSLAGDITGTCRLAVQLRHAKRHGLAGVMVSAEGGRIVQCIARLEGHPDAWVSGPAQAWLASVIERDFKGLELGGDCRLATELIEGLHGALFGAVASR